MSYPYTASLLRKVKKHIRMGGVIAYPTESCYGFGCDPFNYQAIKRIIHLKERSKAKGMIVIASSFSQINSLIQPLTGKDIDELKKFWPGFYSIILPVRKQLPTNLTGSHSKLAVRLTKHKSVIQLCNFLDMPLVSTSANKSGCFSIKTYRECKRQFGHRVMVLPGMIGFAKKPSTIIDWHTRQKLR